MCQNFSESVSRILTQIENGRNRQLNLASQVESNMPVKNVGVRPFTVLVEGNIGSGKTTFLKHFQKFSDQVSIVMEPVEKWRDLKSHNLLQLMYEDPERWSLCFQTYVQLTMLQNHTMKSDKSVRMMERSLFSAKYCFAENLRKSGKMPSSEFEVLTKWFEFILECPSIDLSADLIVYLKTDPEVALRRVKERSRGEEHLINEDYIKDLHQLHEEWLIHQAHPLPAPVMVVDANKDIKDMTELFHVISSNINTKDDEKENAPVESLDNHKSKRPIDKNIVQAPPKRPSILRDSSF